MNDFLPLNKLEEELLDTQRGSKPAGEFVQLLWSSDLALPTANEVKDDGSGLSPILFDKLGANMLATFTSKERMGHLPQLAKYCLVLKGAEVLRRMPTGYGLVVNPGLEVGFEISPAGITEIISKFG